MAKTQVTRAGTAVTALTPQQELGALLATASAAFWLAEQGVNPAVKTVWDAFHYIATSLSVGYANIFPVTQAGKAIGAFVMVVGPALSARALERTGPSGDVRAH